MDYHQLEGKVSNNNHPFLKGLGKGLLHALYSGTFYLHTQVGGYKLYEKTGLAGQIDPQTKVNRAKGNFKRTKHVLPNTIRALYEEAYSRPEHVEATKQNKENEYINTLFHHALNAAKSANLISFKSKDLKESIGWAIGRMARYPIIITEAFAYIYTATEGDHPEYMLIPFATNVAYFAYRVSQDLREIQKQESKKSKAEVIE